MVGDVDTIKIAGVIGGGDRRNVEILVIGSGDHNIPPIQGTPVDRPVIGKGDGETVGCSACKGHIFGNKVLKTGQNRVRQSGRPDI